jgi:phospholipid-binding lipoprotein MlaA
MKASNRITRAVGMLSIVLLLAGCATGSNPRDPLENFNRSMFTFNDNLDRVALKPVATAYKNVIPSIVRTAIGNFFGNLDDVRTALNNLLQGNLEDGFTDVMRLAVNSTLGIGGLIDLGSEYGMSKHKQDFGATLGVWGVQSGPYVVLPFFGASTVRDAAALPVDFKIDPWWVLVYPVSWRNTGVLVRVIDERAAVLNLSNLIEDAALDRYEFIRDAYLQRRANKINRGRPQPSPAYSDDEGATGTPPAPAPDESPAMKPSTPLTPSAPSAPATLPAPNSGTMPQSSKDKTELEKQSDVQLDAKKEFSPAADEELIGAAEQDVIVGLIR